MKRYLFSIVLFLFLMGGVFPVDGSAATTLSQRLSGRILLQVQAHGEGWYVDPVTLKRYYLGRAEDAYALMRAKGLGIRHAELVGYLAKGFPARLSGRILLDVQSHGEAYYVLPTRLTARYLGRAEDAYAIMRSEGLGITDANLAQIVIASDSATPPGQTTTPTPPPTPPGTSVDAIEHQVFDLINQHRQSIGRSSLIWNDGIAAIAREHSANMAAGTVAFGHDGFDERIDAIRALIRISGAGENVAYNQGMDTPAASAVQQWLESSGHLANIEDSSYDHTGIGMVRTANGRYYFTQLFADAQ